MLVNVLLTSSSVRPSLAAASEEGEEEKVEVVVMSPGLFDDTKRDADGEVSADVGDTDAAPEDGEEDASTFLTGKVDSSILHSIEESLVSRDVINLTSSLLLSN